MPVLIHQRDHARGPRPTRPRAGSTGGHTGIRSGTELAALATHSKTARSFIKELGAAGVTDALTKHDAPFGDYRTTDTNGT